MLFTDCELELSVVYSRGAICVKHGYLCFASEKLRKENPMPKGACMDCKTEMEVEAEGSTSLCPECFKTRTGVEPERVALGVDATLNVPLVSKKKDNL